MRAEHPGLEQGRRRAVDRRRDVPPLQHRQRVIQHVPEPVVERHHRYGLGEPRVRIHQFADGRADEVLLQDAQLPIEIVRGDRVRALQEPLVRVAVVVTDNQGIAVGDRHRRRVRLEIDGAAGCLNGRPARHAWTHLVGSQRVDDGPFAWQHMQQAVSGIVVEREDLDARRHDAAEAIEGDALVFVRRHEHGVDALPVNRAE
jgi:hypothetical protein